MKLRKQQDFAKLLNEAIEKWQANRFADLARGERRVDASVYDVVTEQTINNWLTSKTSISTKHIKKFEQIGFPIKECMFEE